MLNVLVMFNYSLEIIIKQIKDIYGFKLIFILPSAFDALLGR